MCNFTVFGHLQLLRMVNADYVGEKAGWAIEPLCKYQWITSYQY
jgi:hypothetical protein